jgi:hypothetical protein
MRVLCAQLGEVAQAMLDVVATEGDNLLFVRQQDHQRRAQLRKEPA